MRSKSWPAEAKRGLVVVTAAKYSPVAFDQTKGDTG